MVMVNVVEMNMASASSSSAPSSSSGQVDFICDDSFEDVCSICLEPFSSLDPPSVTKCKHEYHLHCILEWSQKRNECPICSQNLVLKDPASQELLAGVENDKHLRSSLKLNTVNQGNEVNNDELHVNESDIEHRIRQHFAAIASRARSISRRRRQTAPAVGTPQILPSAPTINMSNMRQVISSSPEHQNLASCFSAVDSAASLGAPTVTQPASSSIMFSSPGLAPPQDADNIRPPVNSSQPPSDDPARPNSSEFVAFSESLKSKISTASIRYKASISKGTHSLKEKLTAHNDSVKELTRGVQREMSAGIAGIARMMERLNITQNAGESASNNMTADKPLHFF